MARVTSHTTTMKKYHLQSSSPRELLTIIRYSVLDMFLTIIGYTTICKALQTLRYCMICIKKIQY
jgi:hypothetical protein